jgi:small subunit ribosomal protein S1
MRSSRGERNEALGQLELGAVVSGTVRRLTDYGAFIDLGGIEGLLPLHDMSYERLRLPSDLFKVGQRVQVKILKLDLENQRILLGHKQLKPDPWLEVERKYPVGAPVRGEVVATTDYGAFLELERGVDGLVHVSEMCEGDKHPSEQVEVGEILTAVVLSVDIEARRMALSLKQAHAREPGL